MSQTGDPVSCVTVGELMAVLPPPVQPGDELRNAVRALIGADLVALPVTAYSGRLVGGLTRHRLLEAWWAGRLC